MTPSTSLRSVVGRGPVLATILVALVMLTPGAVWAQICTDVTFDPPISGELGFGRLYVTSGPSGSATLDPASGLISTSGRLVAAQAGSPLSIRITDETPDCEFLLTVMPDSQELASSFVVVADRIAVLEGTLLSSNAPQREWLVRMNNGVARITIGGVLEMNTAMDGLIDDYVATFTVSAESP